MKKKTLLLVTLCSLFSYNQLEAQEENQESAQVKAVGSLGLGVGFDYGGFGSRVEINIVEHAAAFIGLGYNLDVFGINAGFSLKFLPKRKVTPTLQAMYGFNGVVTYSGNSGMDKTYYGFTAGGGIECKMGKKENKFFLAVNYPFRSEELKMQYESNNLRIGFSIGYNFRLTAK